MYRFSANELYTNNALYGNQSVANTATTTANIFTTCSDNFIINFRNQFFKKEITSNFIILYILTYRL